MMVKQNKSNIVSEQIAFIMLAVDEPTGNYLGFFVDKETAVLITNENIFKRVKPEILKSKGINVASMSLRDRALKNLTPALLKQADQIIIKYKPAAATAPVKPTGVEDLIARAKELGKAAYHAGIKHSFVLDRKAQKLLEGLKVGEGSDKIMKAWYKGWDAENVNAPVPEPKAGVQDLTGSQVLFSQNFMITKEADGKYKVTRLNGTVQGVAGTIQEAIDFVTDKEKKKGIVAKFEIGKRETVGEKITGLGIKGIVPKVIDIVKTVADRFGLATKIKYDNAIPAIVVGNDYIFTTIKPFNDMLELKAVHDHVPLLTISAKSVEALLAGFDGELSKQVGMVIRKIANPEPKAEKPMHAFTFRYAAFKKKTDERDHYTLELKAVDAKEALKEFEKWWIFQGFYWLAAVDGKDVDVADIEIHDTYFGKGNIARGEEGIEKLIARMLPLWEHQPSSVEVNMLVHFHNTIYRMLQGDAKERVTIKHRLRLLGVEFDNTASLATIKKLLATAEKEAEVFLPKPDEKPTKAEPKPTQKQVAIVIGKPMRVEEEGKKVDETWYMVKVGDNSYLPSQPPAKRGAFARSGYSGSIYFTTEAEAIAAAIKAGYEVKYATEKIEPKSKPASKPNPTPAEPPADLDDRVAALVKKLAKKDKFVGHISKLHKKQKELAAATGAAKETVKADLMIMVRKYEKLVEPKKKRAAPGEPEAAKKQKGEVKPKTTGGQHKKKKQAGESAYQKEYKHAKEGTVKMVGEDVKGSRRELWHEYFGMTIAEWEKLGVASDLTIKKFMWERPEIDDQRAKGKSAGHIYMHYNLWRAMAPKPTFDKPIDRSAYRAICEFSVQEINKVNDWQGMRDACNAIYHHVRKQWVGATYSGSNGWNFAEHVVGKTFGKRVKEYMAKDDPRYAQMGWLDKELVEAKGFEGTTDAAYEKVRKEIYEHKARKESKLTEAIDNYHERNALRFSRFKETRWKFGPNVNDKTLKTFDLRAVQIGNWVAASTEIALVLGSAVYGSLWDLAALIGMTDKKSMSLNHRLAMAIGARGAGKAAAHYEPGKGKVVINLTREYGNGAVAHEFAHFLDHHVLKSARDMLGINQELLDFGSHHQFNEYAIHKSGSLGPLYKFRDVVLAWNDLVKVIINSPFVKRSKEIALANIASVSYWTAPHEVFARSFEAYVYDKLPTITIPVIAEHDVEMLMGVDKKDAAEQLDDLKSVKEEHKNPYLVSPNRVGSRSAIDTTLELAVYPQHEERTEINRAFDTFFKAMEGKWDDVFPPQRANMKPRKNKQKHGKGNKARPKPARK